MSDRVQRVGIRLLSYLALSLAGWSCDSKVEVLIVDQRDAGTDAAAPSKTSCQCGDAEVCAAGTCVALPSISAIATGDRHTCRASRGQLFCWGDNSSRQLGLGNDSPDMVTTPMRVPSRSYWLTVAAGARHTCALREPGYLRCWGNDEQGQQGMASGNRQRDQQSEPLEEYTQLKCGGDNCCALRDAGTLYCWGSNRDGNAGVGRDDGAPVEEPTQVDGDALRFRTFSVGSAHSCGITTDQTLWCWGSNASQQLGVSGRSRAVSPVRIGEDDDWIWIAAGGTQTCGIRRGNVLYCWGDNADGQVGIGRVGPDGNLVPTGAPALVTMTSGWVRVEAGQAHACAIKNSQEMYCWGRGDDGQLGLDSDSSLDMPMKLPQGILWRQMALGAAHSCALDTNEPQSRMLCWGANDRGQLGTGDTDPHREPQVVSFSE